MVISLNSGLLRDSRVLVLSQRQIQKHVSSCVRYEFEDLINSFDTIDMVVPENSYEKSAEAFRWIKRLTRSARLADALKPDPNPFELDKEYDLFFAHFVSPWEFLSIRSIKGWRQKCRKAVCCIEELWAKDIYGWQSLLELIQEFDHVFVGLSQSAKAITELTGVPCSYLPPGIDTIKFCPYPTAPKREIEVFNLGRRSPVTHHALLELAEQQGCLYYYDTAGNLSTSEPQAHRRLLANLSKRSNYFIVNRAKINQVEQTGGQVEIGYRYFEGAAAGAVMIGDRPDIPAFHQNFDWEDAVIPMPFDHPHIGEMLTRLNAQPERLAEIRRQNVVNSLLRHDWVYRWNEILQTVGIEPTSRMLSRKRHLRELAEMLASVQRLPAKVG
ncbi:glycosyltransferase family protein [Pantanalinema sp. GBBB05]|uniref:glycosyltransferase n=1 Tax=Pantanalinema sp. GBBB05 TaxID=2604139 RepID=UPI001DF2F6EC|nr:glycosyltransferase family 1 protein [Pantanalinema sp. GBBB05]